MRLQWDIMVEVLLPHWLYIPMSCIICGIPDYFMGLRIVC